MSRNHGTAHLVDKAHTQEVRALLLWLLPDGAFRDRERGHVRKEAWRWLGYRLDIHRGLLKLYWYGLRCPPDHLEVLRAHAAELSRDVAKHSCVTN